MREVICYLAQMIITSGILYAYYHFALRNNRFHRYNRFYLLATVIISIIIPFLDIPVYFTTQDGSSALYRTLTIFSSPADMDGAVIIKAGAGHYQSWLTVKNGLYFLYSAVAFLICLKIFFSLKKIIRLKKNNPDERINNIKFITTSEPGTPFSFFRWLFWNSEIELHSEKGQQVFRHELFHIKQGHSTDVVFAEIVSAIFWINPFFHLIKKEMKAVHEFLADEFAINKNDKWQYAELLLMRAFHTNQSLVNPFFHNQIKRRIAMIITSKKASHQYLRKLLVLPVAATAAALFAFSYKEKKIVTGGSENPVEINRILSEDTSGKKYPDTVSGNNGNRIVTTAAKVASPKRKQPEQKDLDTWLDSKIYGVWISNKRVNNNELLKYKPSDFSLYYVSKLAKNAINYGKHYYQVDLLTEKDYLKSFPADSFTVHLKHVIKDTTKPISSNDKIIFDKVEIESAFPGGYANWRQYLERNLDASVPLKNKAPEGTYTVVVQFLVDVQGNISDVRALTMHGYGMEAEAVRVVRAAGPKWVPAIQNGKQVNSYRKQPITFVVGNGERQYPENVAKPNMLNEVVVVGFPENDIDKIYAKADIPPSFPGGFNAWTSYLGKNIRAMIPVDSGAKAGTYPVKIRFIVSEEGKVSNVTALTKHGYGMEKEAMRLIETGPDWIPATKDGKKVKAYAEQPVTFVIAED